MKQRRIAGIDTLILREVDRGSFSIALEWTNWADPAANQSLGLPPQRIDAETLFELVDLVEQLGNSEQRD